MVTKHILIIGTGSAGKRHAENLASLGCRISCMDPRSDRLDEMRGKIDMIGAYTSMDEAFSSKEVFNGVAVTSPPVFHVEQCIRALEREIPVLLEKPVSPDLESAKKLQSIVHHTSVPLLLGYTYRWWPPLNRVRELLTNRTVGALRHVKFVMSAHLADWHPWENYWDFFMASKALGGGALLDESHWIDLMFWLLGKPEMLMARIGKISDLKIDTDDNVDMIIVYDNGLHVTMHLDLYGRPHEKYIRFVGDEGTILWTMEPNRVAVSKEMADTWESFEFDCERNDMFLGVDREFIEILDGEPVKTCSIEDGVQVLVLIEAARQSSLEGRMIKLS